MLPSPPRLPVPGTRTPSSPALLLAVILAPLYASLPGAGIAAQEPDTLLIHLLEAHRSPVLLAEGRLGGPGADLLLREGAAAQFFLVGEEHGIADIPELTGALFRNLAPHGYRHLVIETSPPLARELERRARSGGAEAVLELSRIHPFAVPFFSWTEEAELLAAAVEGAGSDPILWGVDYEFMATPVLWLRQLEERATSPEVAALAREVAEGEARALERLMSQGDPTDFLLARGDAQALASLRAAFTGDADAEALLDWMEASMEPWALWFAGEPWESNRARTDLIRRAFVEHYRAAGDAPRALLKMGGFHLHRGRTPVNVLDVGTLAAMLAEFEGRTSFHLMAMAGPGTQAAALGPGGATLHPAGVHPWAAPLYQASHPDRWTLFDLRPLRPHLDAGRIAPPRELERLIWGYDAVLVMVGSRGAGLEP